MKKLIIIIFCALLTSCASIKFNPDTGEVKYTRFGDQHIQGFELKKGKDGVVKVLLKGQQSNAEALTEAIKVIGALAVP